jgi:very-short-patch-repair endonuclease
MRRRLLNFYYHPDARTISLDGHGRSISKFQREVGEALSQQGFRLIPEYKVAGRFIDWVVEDRECRLAIECDGDNWHGPDQYEADMARQRMLERCGWTFVRIRGSAFYANQPKAIEELVRAIRAHGLGPCKIADDEAVPRDWIQEVSGKECMKALRANTGESEIVKIVTQEEHSPEKSGATAAKGHTREVPRSTSAQATKTRVGANGSLSTPPTSTTPVDPSASTQRTFFPVLPGNTTRANRPTKSPAPKAGKPQPTASAKSPTTVVTAHERQAVSKALAEAPEGLIRWQVAQMSKISERRIEEIIPILVREGVVKRVETAHSVMYFRS